MGAALSAADLHQEQLVCFLDGESCAMSVHRDNKTKKWSLEKSSYSAQAGNIQPQPCALFYMYRANWDVAFSGLQKDFVCLLSLQKQSFWSTGKAREALLGSVRLGKIPHFGLFVEPSVINQQPVCHLQSRWSVFADAKRLITTAGLRILTGFW